MIEPKKAPKNCFIHVSLPRKNKIKASSLKDNYMNVAFLGMGGNLGDTTEHFRSALAYLKTEGCIVLQCSSVYTTKPWGSQSIHPYSNMVIQLSTTLDAHHLLDLTRRIELLNGRVRESNRNADRTLDIDILCFNSDVVSEVDLEIPHPRMHDRAFVMVPLAEIASEFMHPIRNKSFDELAKQTDHSDILAVKPYTP